MEWEISLLDDGTLDTVLLVRVPKKDGSFLSEEVRFNDVERNEDGTIPDHEWDRLKDEAREEVEERIQAYNEDAQDRRLGRD